MGSCVSRFRARSNVVHPLPAVTHEPATILPADEETAETAEGGCGASHRARHTVDPNIPESFYPTTVRVSREEEQCRLTRSKISIITSEKELRQRVRELLEEWRLGTLLGLIESHALSIPAHNTTTIDILAASLANPNAKYVKILNESNPLCLTFAKAYAIFYWISSNIKMQWTSYANPEAFRSGTEAKHVLEKRESISKGYANLFHSIATASGLKSCVVMGNIKLSRSELSKPTEEFECSKSNQHWWNMVSITL